MEDSFYAIEQRIQRRLWRYKALAIHMVLSMGLFFLMIYLAAQERVGEGLVVPLAVIIILSLVGHAIWLALSEVRRLVTMQEYTRAGYPLDAPLDGKRKRLDENDDPADFLDLDALGEDDYDDPAAFDGD